MIAEAGEICLTKIALRYRPAFPLSHIQTADWSIAYRLQQMAWNRLHPAALMKGNAVHGNVELDGYMEILFVTLDLAARTRVDGALGPVELDLAQPADGGVGWVFFGN